MKLGGLYHKLIAIVMMILIISITPVFAVDFELSAYNAYSDNDEDVIQSGQEFTYLITNATNNVSVSDGDANIPCDCDDMDNGNYSCACYFAGIDNAGTTNIDFDGVDAVDILVDSAAPTIDIKKCKVIGQNISLNFEVNDSLGDDSDNCAGIKEVNIFVDNYLEKTLSVAQTINNCSYSKDFNFTLDNPIEEFKVEVKATDNVGNSNSSYSENLTMDVNPPLIQDYFELWRGDVILDKVAINNPSSPVVDVAVYIDEQNLVFPVTADLSALNNLPTQNIGYDLKSTYDCNKVDENSNIHKCVFSNVALHVPTTNLKIKVTAADNQSNVVRKKITQEFEQVVSQNEVVWLGPNQEQNCYDEKCFVGNTTIFEVVIAGAEESSFSVANVPIKVSQFATNSIQNPFVCENDGANWICKYIVRLKDEVTNGVKNVYVDTRGTDDYGRRLTGLTKDQVIIDTEKPELIGSKDDVEIKVNGLSVLDSCLTSNDVLTVNFEAKDDYSNKLIAWSNNNFTVPNYQSSDCSKEGDKFVCSLNIRNFANSVEQDKDIEIFVSDLAGNKLSVKNVSAGLCEPNLEDTPVFISSVTTDDSFEVDKRIASYKYWKSYIPLTFNGLRNNAKLTRFEIDSCTAHDDDAGTDYVYSYDDSFSVIPNNNGKGGTAIVYIGGQDILTDEVELNCQMHLFGHDNRYYYYKPQVINFTTTLKFSGSNIAGPDEIIQEEIDTAKKRVKQIERQYEVYEDIDTYLGTMCKVAESMAVVSGVIQAVNSLLYIVFAWWLPEVPEWFDNNVASITTQFVTGYFWPPGNPYSWALLAILPLVGAPGPGPGAIIKTTCWIYNCKFYDISELTSGIVDAFKADAAADAAKKAQEEREKAYAAKEEARTTALDIMTEAVLFEDDFVGEKIFQMGYDLYPTNEQTYADFPQFAGPHFEAESAANRKKTGLNEMRDYSNTVATGMESWILNPYKSRHTDTLCVPAILFNYKKEKQIQCMYIKCLESAKNSGMGIQYCDDQKEFRDCLYLDSAAYREADGSWGELLAKNLGPAFFAAAPGVAIDLGIYFGCKDFFAWMTPGSAASVPFGQSLLCGTYIAFTSVQTIYNGYSSTLSSFQDIELGNQCEGINFD
jgi:hypothetical protein